MKSIIQIGFCKEIINILEQKKEPFKNVMNRAPAALLNHEKLKKYA